MGMYCVREWFTYFPNNVEDENMAWLCYVCERSAKVWYIVVLLIAMPLKM